MITSCIRENVFDLRGLSTDTKPTKTSHEGLPIPGNGSTYFEMDTGKVYVFDETGSTGTWREV